MTRPRPIDAPRSGGTGASAVGATVAVMLLGGCLSLLGDDFTIDSSSGGGGTQGTGVAGGATGATGGGGRVASPCSNMVRDAGETDIDCGGPCIAKCGLDEGCSLDSDCDSGRCGDGDRCVLPPPCGGACQPWQACVAETCTPGAVLYVNLGGGTFSYGQDDDASLNIQQVSNEALPSTMDPYGGTTFDQDAIFDAVVADFAPFDVQVTRTRPAATTPYQMVVVTPSGSALAPNEKLWVPPADCGDEDDDNVAFVIFSAQSDDVEGITPAEQATVVSKAFGIMMGLEPVNGVTDIMHDAIAGASMRQFENACHGRPSSTTWLCNAQHQAGCNGNANLQNSFSELTTLFGPAP